MDLAVSEVLLEGRRLFTGIVRDITERKRAENALLDSEARTRAVLAAAVDAIITIDERGIIESANPASEKLFGYTEAELIGQERQHADARAVSRGARRLSAKLRHHRA